MGPPDRNVAARRENADWFSSNVEWLTENGLPAGRNTECAGTNGVTGRPTLRQGWHQTRSLARRGPGGVRATVILRERSVTAAAGPATRRQRRAASGRPVVGRFRNRIEGSPVARAAGHRGMRDGGNHPCFGGKRTGTLPQFVDNSVQPDQLGHMITATISDTKNRLSELLARVQSGETLIISDRKTPVARVERICGISGNPHVQPARKAWNPLEILAQPILSASEGSPSLVGAVREERAVGW